MSNLIGRKKEIQLLKSFASSKTSEFVAVYGRRRVGKTFLIRETFKNNFIFQITGLANATLQQQLINFNTCLQKNNKKEIPFTDTWQKAFQQLITILEQSKSAKKIVFIDELPWFDTPKSYFISALEHFWNSWASARKDVLLIVCGSSASWMINKLINNKGGLHNRVTQKIKVNPFTLQESELFLKSKRINWNRYQIIETYMTMGGIPFYLNAIKPNKSATQNIDALFFAKDGLLKDEFANLYASLFKHPENHLAITEALSKKAIGLTRDEIISESKLPNGGGTTKVLEELEESGFIRKYLPYNNKIKQSVYQLTDFYTLFYYKFIKNKKATAANFWINTIDSNIHRAWAGYAFEQVCMEHVYQIKKELGISGILTNEVSWRSNTKANGAQIDLLIDRNDQTITICEMKFSINEFSIDKKYAQVLRNKIGVFKKETGTRKSVSLAFITSYGLKTNSHSLDLVQNNITMECLFDNNN